MNKDYHNHVKYCKHSDLEVMDIADEYSKRGFVEFGYSDHIPYPEPYDSVDSNGQARMLLKELPSYLQDIDEVIEKYKGKMSIWKGLESEYIPSQKKWYKELLFKKGVDYLILGIHVVKDLSNENYNFNRNCKSKKEIQFYWDSFKEGLETGLFLYAVHPDFYMKSYEKWDENCDWLANNICSLAKKNNISLGFNINGFWKGPREIGKEFRCKYPIKQFWEISKKYQNKIILESDVHHKKQLYDTHVISNSLKLIDDWGLRKQLIDGLDIKEYRRNLLKKYKKYKKY